MKPLRVVNIVGIGVLAGALSGCGSSSSSGTSGDGGTGMNGGGRGGSVITISNPFAGPGNPGIFAGSGPPGMFAGNGPPGMFAGNGPPGMFAGSGNPGIFSQEDASASGNGCSAACAVGFDQHCPKDDPSDITNCVSSCNASFAQVDPSKLAGYQAIIDCILNARIVCNAQGHADAPSCQTQLIENGNPTTGNGGSGGNDQPGQPPGPGNDTDAATSGGAGGR